MKKDIIHIIADYLFDYGWESMTCIPTVLFTLVSIFGPSWGTIVTIAVIVFSVILCVICTYKIIKKSKSITSLENEKLEISSRVQELEATIEKFSEENYKLFEYSLSLLFKDFNLDDKSRISVYKKNGDRFVVLGRYSTNPELIRINRKSYPLNEGFIGKAYTEGFYFIDDLPEYTEDKQKKYYDTVMKKCTIAKEVLKNISMKSRTYYCKALQDFRNVERKAVIVIESIDAARFKKEDIRKLVEEEEGRLKYFIENFKFAPESNIENAKNKGF